MIIEVQVQVVVISNYTGYSRFLEEGSYYHGWWTTNNFTGSCSRTRSYYICYTHPADAATITVELLLVLVIKQFALEAEILEEGKTLTLLFPTES